MATSRYQTADLRRQVGSPRPKGRENKDTLCRNVLIYGHCRYEDQGCAFSHDQNKNNSNSDFYTLQPRKPHPVGLWWTGDFNAAAGRTVCRMTSPLIGRYFLITNDLPCLANFTSTLPKHNAPIN
ncbi:Uncharacterized protein HZ326_13657 [Fusarium oxysporum f. sp. albedinis]|nr:Uncharacterized protein HZ326_13657 [Fusarium oxysporum f. sp. albedinis]